MEVSTNTLLKLLLKYSWVDSLKLSNLAIQLLVGISQPGGGASGVCIGIEKNCQHYSGAST